MKPIFSFSLLFTFSLLLLLLVVAGEVTGRSLISGTCKKISKSDPNVKFNFCTNSLQSAPASRCASLRGLAKISIRLTRNNLTDTRCHVKELLLRKHLDPYVRACLDDCFVLYSDAISSVKEAMKNFNSKRYVDANIELSSVLDDATTCEDGFRERKGVVSPLTKRNNDTFELSAMALSIIHLID
ncbi:hypothetical protein LguiA_019340 [Lonicera macranthoides]